MEQHLIDDLLGRKGLFLHKMYNRAIHILGNETFASFVHMFSHLGRWKNQSLISFVEIYIKTYTLSYSVCRKVCLNRYQTKVMILDTKYFKPFTWWTITQIFLFVKVHCNLQYDHAQKITKNQRENGINGNFTHKRIISQLYIKIPINIIYLNIYIFILSFCIDPTSNNYAHDVFKKGYLVAIFVTTCF